MQTKIGVAQSIYVVALLAEQKENTPMKSHVISEQLRVSDSYLKKIIRQLVVAGILSSSASKTGGLSLARPADEITILDIYLAIEDDKPFFNCESIVQTFRDHNDSIFLKKGKETISIFQKAQDAYMKCLKSYTIADLLDRETKKEH